MNGSAYRVMALGLALLTACNDEITDDPSAGFGDGGAVDAGTSGSSGEGGSTGDAGDGSAGDAGGDGGQPVPEGCIDRPVFGGAENYPTFAVRNSDYSAASVSLLDEDGNLLDDSYIGPASMVNGLPGGLHGDISLPTSPAEPTVLTIVARAKGDYVLRMDLATGELLNQVRTQATPFEMDEPGAAYASNPHDYLYVNGETAFVTRFQPNLDPDADALNRGDDLLVLNPETGERLERISLRAWHETIEVDDGAGGTLEETVYARPSGLVGMGCHAVFGTSRLSLNWNGTDGAIGVLDLREKTVEKVDLDTLRNCGSVIPVAGDERRAVVQCSGSPWADPASTGLALVHLDEEGTLRVEHTYLQDESDDPLLSASTVSLGGTRVVSMKSGDYSAGTGDVLYELDLETGDYAEVFTSDGPGEIGGGAYDPVRGVLYVPDASAGVRVFTVSDGEIEQQRVLELDAALPPRAVAALRPL